MDKSRPLHLDREALSLIIESPVFGVLIVDTSGDIRFANTTIQWMFGYETSEVVGTPVEMLLPERIRERHPEFRDSYFRNPEIKSMGAGRDLRARRKDGTEFPIEIGLYPIHINGDSYAIATLVDITGRKKAEHALEHSERLLKKTQEIGRIGGWELDLETGRLSWTDEVRRIHEVPYDYEPTLENAIAFYAPEDRPVIEKAVQHAIDTGDGWDLECRFITVKGRRLIVRAQGETESRGDKVVRLFGVFKDITREKEEEEEKRRMQEQIQHAQKLESLGVLAGGIAHDFNNMLLAILGNAELALEDLSPTAPGRENIRDVIATTVRAAELCRQMLAYSGKGKFVVQALDLSELVEEILHLLEVSISKSALLKLRLAKNLPAIEADASQIRQIIMNLVTNASDAIGEKSGVITVTTGLMECDEAYLAETYLDQNLTPGYYVYCEVADTGCGMDEETRSKIFDPFFTTKFTGRGLGMAAVLGILMGHRGAIKVYSEVGRGTNVKVLFPASEKSAEPIQNLPERLEGWMGSGTILVVDDEKTVRTLAKNILEKVGFDVLLAPDGREAVEIFREHGDHIELVLLDMTMPRLDGKETFAQIRRMRESTRVILSSGYNEQEATSQFAGKGLSGFIQKPYRPIDLIHKIQEVLGR